MCNMKKIISFASDFGLEDGSVGVVKGVINRIDEDLKVIDISHGIPPQNIKYGSLLLMRAIQYIPPGVLLQLVDPGVGSERKPIAIKTDWGVMIGPDNGLLNLACATVGGAKQAFELENENWIIPHEGNTFHARDIFSPFAAAYASGQLELEDFGQELNLEDLKQYLIPLTDISDKEIKGEILYVDNFGNCQTNISPEELKEKNFQIGDSLSLKVENQELTSKWCNNYENSVGGVGIVTDSWGMISIFLSNGDASKLLNCKDGSKVTIKAENLTKRLNLK
jgi:S-adenosylmethionine hydrolase